MDLKTLRAQTPEYANLDDLSVVKAEALMYPDAKVEDIARALGVALPAPPAPPRTIGGFLKDTGISALKGAIAVPEAAVGLADLATGGQAGRAAQGLGFRPAEAKQFLDEQYSDPQKAAFKAIQDANGFVDTGIAALTNPSTIAHSIVESLPAMGAGGVLGRAVMGLGLKGVGAATAGSIGEGTVMAGSAAEQIRQGSKDGLLTGEQAGLAGATGAGGAGLAMLGAGVASGMPGVGNALKAMGFQRMGEKVAKGMGIHDIDTMIAAGKAHPGAQKGLVRSILEGAFTEGVLEELPQSVLEQVLQNKALDRPLEEGVDKAAVMGLLAGGAMGAGAQAVGRMGKPAPAGVSDVVQREDGTYVVTPPADSGVPQQQVIPQPDGSATASPAKGPLENAAAAASSPEPGSTLPNREEAGGMAEAVQKLVEYEVKTRPDPDKVLEKMHRMAEQELQATREFDRKAAAPTAAEGDVLAPDGKPFISKARAVRAAGTLPGSVEQVDGGWVFRPTAESKQNLDGAQIDSAPSEDERLAGKRAIYAAHKDVANGSDEIAANRVENAQAKTNELGAPMTLWRHPTSGTLGLVPASRASPLKGGEKIGTLYPESKAPVTAVDAAAPESKQNLDGVQIDSPATPVFGGGEGANVTNVAAPEKIKVYRPNGEAVDAEVAATSESGAKIIRVAGEEHRLGEEYDESNPSSPDYGVTGLDGAPKVSSLSGEELKGATNRAKQRYDAQRKTGADSPGTYGALRDLNALRLEAKRRESIEEAAHAAATSPTNDLPEPTDAQKEAGNYKKGHITVQGLNISVENPRDSERRGKRPDGTEWAHKMSDHYGYVKRTVGADDEQVDVYVGNQPDAPQVFVVDQVNADGTFDEHKAMIGFPDEATATAAYASNFDPGWKIGKVTAMPIDGFKEWLNTGDLKKPVNTEGLQDASQTTQAPADAGTVAQNEPAAPLATGASQANSRPRVRKPRAAAVGEAADAQPAKLPVADDRRDGAPASDDADPLRTALAAGFAKHSPAGLTDAQRAGLAKTADKLHRALIDGDAVALADILTPGNKVSRAVFEDLMPGAKLPRTIGRMKAFAEDLTKQIKAKVPEAERQPAPEPVITIKPNGDGQYLVRATVDGKVAGQMGLTVKTVGGHQVLSIDDIGVKDGYQGQGIGTMLYQHALDNLPTGIDGLMSEDATRQNTEQVPAIHSKLKSTGYGLDRIGGGVLLTAKGSKPPKASGPSIEVIHVGDKQDEAKPLPAGEYKPGQEINHAGRKWRVTAVAHTGQEATIRSADGGRFVEHRVKIKQAGPKGVSQEARDNSPVVQYGRAMRDAGLEFSGLDPLQWAVNIGDRSEIHALMAGRPPQPYTYTIERFLDGFVVESTTTVKLGDASMAVRDMRSAALDDERNGEKGKEYPTSSRPAPAAAPANPDALRAQADLQNALADIGDIFGKNVRATMMPEQEQKLLPVLTRLFDAAFRLGYHKFKDAARFALGKIREALGDDVADLVTLEHLQGAYIGMSGGKAGADAIMDVAKITSKDAIEAADSPAAPAPAAPPQQVPPGKWFGTQEKADDYITKRGLADTHQVVPVGRSRFEIQPKAAAPATSAPAGTTLTDYLMSKPMPQDNPALRKLVEAYDRQEATPARMKEAQEVLEGVIVERAAKMVMHGNSNGSSTREIFDKMVALYNSQPLLNVRTSTSIENQAYSTPAPLAYVASRLAGIDGDTKVLEPTAGTGMLLMESDPKNAYVNELNDFRAALLQDQGYKVTQIDAASRELWAPGSMDAIITNPPFGSLKDDAGNTRKQPVDGYKIGQIDHLIAAHALTTMKDDGKAVLIIGANKIAGGRSNDDLVFMNWLYGNYNVHTHFEVDGKLYTRQGASWPVRVIAIDGRQKSDAVAPAEGTIERVYDWSDVYERYEQSLAASREVGRDPANDSVGADQQQAGARPVPQPAGKQTAGTGGRGPRRGDPGAGNVAGTGPGTVGDQRADPREPVGVSPDAQRGDEPAADGDRLDAAGEFQGTRAAVPAGNRGDDRLTTGENQFQTKYVARSARKDEGVLIPVNMADPLQAALDRLEDAVGDIDQFAAKELGYKSVAQMHESLMGLQVDSVASAIHQINSGKAIIIADQTGIGKGRQAAAIIRWAIKTGKVPVFVTVKPSLFTDMYGDLKDIGTDDARPFIVNLGESIKGDGDEKLFHTNTPAYRRSGIQALTGGELPKGSNAVFLTYSQINQENAQRGAITGIAGNAVFILDESHNAGGESATGDFVKSVLDLAKGTVYLSATYAKRPDNMPLYFKTDMGEAVADDETLMQAMESGGLPLQTVVSNNLVKAGQMFRRERSYDGVNIETKVDTARRQEHEALSDRTTQALRAIVAADHMFHDVFVKAMQKEASQVGGRIMDGAGNQATTSVDHTQFSSVVHNFVRQMLLGLNAQASADEAITALKAGKKPLIALENTMGSFLGEYADNHGIKTGEALGKFDYRTVLSRALERTRYVQVVDPQGNKSKLYIPLEKLDPITRSAYKRAQDVIDALDISIPVSPLDWIRQAITDAGYSVAEITGRNLRVDYSNKTKPTLDVVDMKEQKDKVNTTRRFNAGDLDAIILNVSGSTGISLHASEKFRDQRQRKMIVAQAAQDINIFMQMLGRIHRTGQVALPDYLILNADLPAVRRPTALLSGKMKSLNANTSSNTESATSVEALDMMNKYGDQVVGQYLADNPALAMAMGIPTPLNEEGKPAEDDLARKATGRLALMPVATQKQFYEDVEAQYATLIDYLNKTNQNELEPRTFDFDAKEMKREKIFEGSNPASPFGQDADYVEYSVKAQGKAMTPAEIQAEIDAHLGGKTPQQHREAIETAHVGDYNKLYASLPDEQKVPAHLVMTTGSNFAEAHQIGSMFRVDINGDQMNAVVTNLRNTHKKTGNPFALSKYQVTIAVNGSLRHLTVPGTQFANIEVSKLAQNYSLESLFKVQAETRDTAKIITGNLLGAYGELAGTKGTIISFTKEDGTTDLGVLLPKAFSMGENTRGGYRLRNGAEALRFLQESGARDIDKLGISTRDSVVRITPNGGGILIRVPKSKSAGGKYFLDKHLLAVTGDFTSAGNHMLVTVSASKAPAAIDALMKKQAIYTMPSMSERAKEMFGGKPAFSQSGGYQTSTPRFKAWFGDSKVVDAEGKPLVVYHGTATPGFSMFDPAQARSEGGAFFFSHSSLMKNPATNANGYATRRGGAVDDGAVMPVYLRMTNPLIAGFTEPMPEGDEAIGQWLDRMQKFNRSLDADKNGYYQRTIKEARRNGHDGVIFKNVEDERMDGGRRWNDETDVYAVFAPEQIKSATGNNGGFDPSNPDIRFRQDADTTTARQDVGRLQATADAITDKFSSKPQVVVTSSVLAPATPKAVQAEARRRIAKGGTPPSAVFYDGRVYLFADAIRTDAQAATAIAHEVLGHYGLRGNFGDALDGILKQIAATRPAQVSAMIRKNGMKASDRLAAAEEILAEMAEKQPDIGFVDRAIAAIRTWLRENLPALFGKITLTDAEIIRSFILPARRFVESGERTAAPGPASFSQGAQPFYSALEKGIEAMPDKPLARVGWEGAINAMVNKGQIKADEVEWSGLREWLEMQTGKVSKDDVLNYLQANGVQVQEVTLKSAPTMDQVRDKYMQAMVRAGEKASVADQLFREMQGFAENGEYDDAMKDRGFDLVMKDGSLTGNEIHDAASNYDGGDTKYSQYTLPGGENYREVLLTLPGKTSGKYWAMEDTIVPGSPRWLVASRRESDGETVYNGRSHATKDAAERAIRELEGKGDYRSSHWDEPNILAHIRLNDRHTPGVDMADIEERIRAAVGASKASSMGNGAPEMAVAKGAVTADEAAWYAHSRGFKNVPAKPAPTKKVLFVEEIQSDWAQAGKKNGFAAPALTDDQRFEVEQERERLMKRNEKIVSDGRASGDDQLSDDAAAEHAKNRDRIAAIYKELNPESGLPPVAPFVGKTDAWVTLALKRIVKMAVDGGYDRVAFVTGQQSADRYGLSKAVDKVEWFTRSGLKMVYAHPKNGGRVGGTVVDGKFANGSFPDKDVSEVLGAEIAAKIAADADGELTGEGLAVGGAGMKAFYDKIVPAAANKLLAKVGGGKMATVTLPADGKTSGFHPTRAAAEAWVRENGVTEPVTYSREARYQNQYSVRGANGSMLVIPQTSQQAGFDITDAMREKAGPGLPMFSQSMRDETAVNNPRDYWKIGVDAMKEFNATPGKLHWWDESVGTPFHLAQRYPQFGAVFNRVQDFMRDVSLYATEAASLAPRILPKLETWSDIMKSALPAADTQALKAPVFEGTLTWARDQDGRPVKVKDLEDRYADLSEDGKAKMMLSRGRITEGDLKRWENLPIESYEGTIRNRFEREFLTAGVVWTDAELKDKFKLSPEQVSLYREFRAAVDRSITNLAISDMLRLAGQDAPQAVRDEVLATGDVMAASEFLREFLFQEAKAAPDRSGVLTDTAGRIHDKATAAQRLMDRGYAPLSRFGRYTVDVVDADGERVYFGLFEGRIAARQMAARLQEQFPEATVRRGTTSEEQYKMFAGMTPETAELFGEMLGLDADGSGKPNVAFQKFLKEAKSSRSAMKRLIERKGIAGFSEDAGRVLAGFVSSNARQTAANLHQREIAALVQEVGKDADGRPQSGELKDAAIKLMNYVRNPQEEAVPFRAMLFAQYIGGSIASMLVNMTQPLQITMPYLSQYVGVVGAARVMRGALADAWNTSKTGDAELDAALNHAEEQGIVAPQEIHQLMAQAQGKGALKSGDGTMAGDAAATVNNAIEKLVVAWGKPFSMAELFNRRVTFVAAFRVAKAKGMPDPAKFAADTINQTQFVYNKGNKPQWARGAIGSTLFTFKTYSIGYMELMHRLYTQGGPEGKKAALFSLAMLMLMGGAGGLPFVQDIEDVVDAAAQRMGYNFSLKQARRQLLEDTLGTHAGQFLEKGVSGLPGVPLDVSGRFGMGNLIPGTGLLLKKTDHTRDVAELFGPAGDFTSRTFQAAGQIADGDPLKAAVTISPKAASNLAKAAEMATMGMYTDQRGRKVIDTDATDAVMKAIGFQPNDVARVQDATFNVQRRVAFARMTEAEIADEWAQAVFKKDQAAAQSAQKRLRDWNAANPESQIRINFQSQVLRRVREMNKSKVERLAATTPTEMRKQVTEELKGNK